MVNLYGLQTPYIVFPGVGILKLDIKAAYRSMNALDLG